MEKEDLMQEDYIICPNCNGDSHLTNTPPCLTCYNKGSFPWLESLFHEKITWYKWNSFIRGCYEKIKSGNIPTIFKNFTFTINETSKKIVYLDDILQEITRYSSSIVAILGNNMIKNYGVYFTENENIINDNIFYFCDGTIFGEHYKNIDMIIWTFRKTDLAKIDSKFKEIGVLQWSEYTMTHS